MFSDTNSILSMSVDKISTLRGSTLEAVILQPFLWLQLQRSLSILEQSLKKNLYSSLRPQMTVKTEKSGSFPLTLLSLTLKEDSLFQQL